MKLLTLIFAFACFLAKGQTVTLNETYFTVQFDTVYHAGILNSYVQTKAHQKAVHATGKIDRATIGGFLEDSLIPKRWQVANQKLYDDYNKAHPKSKINVGHIIPFEPMAYNRNAAKRTMLFCTNTQIQYGYFNQHCWAFVEKIVLDSLGAIYDSMPVYTGVLINAKSARLGAAFIPDYFYKAAVFNGQSMAWLGANTPTNTDTNPNDILIDPSKLRSEILIYYPNLKLPF